MPSRDARHLPDQVELRVDERIEDAVVRLGDLVVAERHGQMMPRGAAAPATRANELQGHANGCRNLAYTCDMTRRLAEVAKKVGVSEATVSRVLNGKPGVSPSTREAVLTALDVLGYERPSKLRGERARLVGLVLPELQNPIFPAFAEVMGVALAQRGFTPVLCTQTAGGVSEADYVDLLLQQQVSGVVFAGGLYAQATAPHGHYARLRERARPDGPRERLDPGPRLPDRLDRRRGGDGPGDGPPALARPHTNRAPGGSRRPRPVEPQARRRTGTRRPRRASSSPSRTSPAPGTRSRPRSRPRRACSTRASPASSAPAT